MRKLLIALMMAISIGATGVVYAQDWERATTEGAMENGMKQEVSPRTGMKEELRSRYPTKIHINREKGLLQAGNRYALLLGSW